MFCERWTALILRDLGAGATLIDQPGNRRLWGFVSEAGEAQLCVKDPGFDVDLYLSLRLREMTRLWRGELTLTDALRVAGSRQTVPPISGVR